MDKYYEYEKAYKSRPHLVLLGAGASMAAIPQGDKNGLKTSVMDGFLEKLGMDSIIAGLDLKTKSKNLEDIYSEIAENQKFAMIREMLDTKIREYFSSFEIPDTPTVYDFLLLSLRKKDLVATFNWDPLLLQAYQRVSNITNELPELAFLHGNVLVGYCEKHKFGGNIKNSCPVCRENLTPSRLLYPINKKDYNADSYTLDNWKAVRNNLREAYLVTIFGYSAPKTDIEAIDILKNAWGDTNERNMEDFEFIDIRDEDDLIDTWSDFVHTHHYSYTTSFFSSSLARFPRRSIEELFDRTQNCIWTSPTNPFKPDMTFDQLREVVTILVDEEAEKQDSFITLPNPSY